MSIGQDTGSGTGPGPDPTLPADLVEPADLAEFADQVEQSLLEAAACGDPGYGDRVFRSWWLSDPCWDPDDPGPDPDPRDAVDPDTGWFPEDGWTPADPMDRDGRAAWMAAVTRDHNRTDARYLAAIHQTGHTQGLRDGHGRPARDRFALAEVGNLIEHSVQQAGSWLTLAEAVIDRLPMLYAAMDAGWLDLIKAKVVVAETRAMPDDLAAMAVARVLGQAPGVGSRTLGALVGVAAAGLDPDWAAHREAAAIRCGRVSYVRNPAGTGDIALRDLDAATQSRIAARTEALTDTLHRAARAADIPLGRPGLRLLVLIRQTDGSHVGADDDTLLAALVAELPAWHAHLANTRTHPHGDPDSGGPDDNGPVDGGSDDGGPDDGGPDDGGPDDGGPEDGGPEDGGPEDGPASSGSPVRGPDTAVRTGTLELRTRLSTTLGLDDLPAEIITGVADTGRFSASRTRRLLTDLRTGDTPTDTPVEWRVVLVDPAGHLEHVLLVRPDTRRRTRPHGRGKAQGQIIVELAAPTTLLAALHPDDHPAWARLIRTAQQRLADLAANHALLGGPNHPATSLTDAAQRMPGAELDRYLRVRDRHCIGPLCTRPAHRAQIDHTLDWTLHGPTAAANLGAACAHCHALKHQGGWALTQPSPGHFQWLSPLGATRTITPRPVIDTLTDAAPRPTGRRRPVLDPGRPPRDTDTGWRHRIPAPVIDDDEIPTRPGDPATPSPNDPPPF